MLRGIYGDPERFVKQYWSKWDRDIYFTGDGAKRDDDGYYWVIGRVDDVLNVSGHRWARWESRARWSTIGKSPRPQSWDAARN